MKIKFNINSDNPRVFEGDYEFLEGISRQEGSPSFVIYSHNKSENAEIKFIAQTIDEVDLIIQELSDAKELMISDKEKELDINEENKGIEKEDETEHFADNIPGEIISKDDKEKNDIENGPETDSFEEIDDPGKNF